MFENMGVQVADERPYELKPRDGAAAWIYDFGLTYEGELQAEQVREAFQDAFIRAWRGEVENDGYNRLVLRARLTAREITVLRAVARYLRQAGTTFSDRYVEQALVAHPDVAGMLIELFYARFDPARADEREAASAAARAEQAIDDVESLDQDRILRSFLAVVQAMLRTNYFQRARRRPARSPTCRSSSTRRACPGCRCRARSSRSSSTRRASRACTCAAARSLAAGLRWSDRLEDFRTEVLGLMKAQMVKNAVIVPVGAKGGFVVKRPPRSREDLPEEVQACYRTFIRGLLDVTDNIRGRRGRPPAAGRALRRGRPLPRRRRRPRHGHLLRRGERDRRRVRLLAGRRLRLGRLERLRPQGDGDHRPRRLGVGQAPLPRAGPRRPDPGLHRRRGRRHVGRRVRQRDAALPPHPPRRRLRPPRHLHRPGSRPGALVRGAKASVRAAGLVVGRLRHEPRLGGWRRVPAQREVDPAVEADPRRSWTSRRRR